jgi:hypothetical protein
MPNCERVLVVKRIIKRVRGGSQSFLVEAVDGNYYIAKCIDNPQGNRTLINEVLGTRLLEKLSVSAPTVRFLRIPSESENPDHPFVYYVGDKRVPITRGPHLGSKCPVNPLTKAIFDYLPPQLINNVVNRDDFAKTFAVDHILGQVDARQAIFVKERGFNRKGLRAYLIDHGYLLNGTSWTLCENEGYAGYYQTAIYPPDMLDICLRTVPAIMDFIENDWLQVINDVPANWRSLGDFETWSSLRLRLLAREKALPAQLERHLARLTSRPVSEMRRLLNSVA